MSGAGGFVAWCGAIAGWAAPLTIGTFVVVGARHRRNYDAWRDTMTELGDGNDGVAWAFVAVNVAVALLLGTLAVSTQHVLHTWALTIPVIVAAAGSLIFGFTARGPEWVHKLHDAVAVVVLADIVAVPFITWFALQHRGDALTVFRFVSLGLGSAAILLTAGFAKQHSVRRKAEKAENAKIEKAEKAGKAKADKAEIAEWVDSAGRASGTVAGLFERLVWVAGYGWVVALACTLVHPGWPSALALVAWLALALWRVLRPGWRDPSLPFRLADCQPGTLAPLGNVTCGILRVGTIDDAQQFLHELGSARAGKTPLLGGKTKGATSAVTIAFTARGLCKLKVQYHWHAPFVQDAFREGMLERAQSLGDVGPSDPTHWDEGWRHPESLHVAFWIQTGITKEEAEAAKEDDAEASAAAFSKASARAETELAHLEERVTKRFTSVTNRLRIATHRLSLTSQEHFGFVDGLSQPWVDGIGASKRKRSGKLDVRGRQKPIALGEFVVGQVDETGDIFPVPAPAEVFLGGTFLVVRKLEQDVAGFRRYAGDDDTASRFAARLVGRRRDGPALEDLKASRNDFSYGNDPEGQRCPLGAHVRRANPRDALGFGSTLSARRRIIRRGMPYGPPWDKASSKAHRGLLFLAYNVRIAEQFEFIQTQWLNDGSSFGLGSIPDPVSGGWPHRPPRPVVLTDPPPVVHAGLPSFVTTKGGEYFFVPSVNGLDALAASGERDVEPAKQVGAAGGDRPVPVAPG